MEFNEFKFLINRITILSDKCAGLKTQNKILEKKVKELKSNEKQLEFEKNVLAEKLTKLNHENNKLKESHVTPASFHGTTRAHSINLDCENDKGCKE